MTLIVLLILASVSLSAVFSDKGIFSRAESAGIKYNEVKAKEVLETVLLADGQYEKNINPDYNQDDFLDELIKNEIPGSRIQGDVAIIGEWAFELDRSVPKIGRGLGKVDKLVFPTLNATAELAKDKKDATINITAKEEKNGINKIEIWLLGEKIEEYTYDNVKTEITINPPYTVTQNGKYTIKAYGELWESKEVEVTGIVSSVKFEPNGNEEWKKEHSTIVTINETANKVVKAKYVWTNSVTTPEDEQFPEEQTFKSGDTITKNEVTGTYYLWTMLETQSGEKLKWRSEGFNFDNQGPTVTLVPTPSSETTITLTATASDEHCEIAKYDFYINGLKVDRTNEEEKSSTITVNFPISTENVNCSVKVYDSLGNEGSGSSTGRTLLHSWKVYNAVREKTWQVTWETDNRYLGGQINFYANFKVNDDGRPQVSGSTSNWGGYTIKNGNLYKGRGTCDTTGSVHTNWKSYADTRAVITEVEGDPKQGTEDKGTVTGTSSDKYPHNGANGDNWYIYSNLV